MAPVGSWFRNEKTKELARVKVSPDENHGTRLVADLWLDPGAAVFGAHVHDALRERFTVLEGQVGVRLDRARRTARAGEVVEIPAATTHEFWNVGSGVAHVLVEVDAERSGSPLAARFVEMIEAGFGLANSGRTNEKGMPSPLWLAALAHEYRDVLRFTRPPAFLQRALFAPLAALARAGGRDPAAPWLHGTASPARVPPPEQMPGEPLRSRRAIVT